MLGHVRAGEVGCSCCRWVWIGSLVGWSSFMMVWFESFIMLLIVVPLWSVVGEYHVL